MNQYPSPCHFHSCTVVGFFFFNSIRNKTKTYSVGQPFKDPRTTVVPASSLCWSVSFLGEILLVPTADHVRGFWVISPSWFLASKYIPLPPVMVIVIFQNLVQYFCYDLPLHTELNYHTSYLENPPNNNHHNNNKSSQHLLSLDLGTQHCFKCYISLTSFILYTDSMKSSLCSWLIDEELERQRHLPRWWARS